MNVLLNELSYLLAPKLTQDAILEIKNSLIKAVKFFQLINRGRQTIFWCVDGTVLHANHKLINNRNYEQLLEVADREERTVLLAIFGKLNPLTADENQQVIVPAVNARTAAIPAFEELEGFGFGALSLLTHDVWCAPKIEYISAGKPANILNFPRLSFDSIAQYSADFLDFHLRLINRFVPNNGAYLTYAHVSNLLLGDARFKAAYEALVGGDRLAAIQEVGAAVAIINGFSESVEANRKNRGADKKRNIFFSEEQGIYLSIDYEKGAFEVLNRKGKHLGEMNFNGEFINGPDNSGKHNIVV